MGHRPYPNLERARRRVHRGGSIRGNRLWADPNAGCTLVLPRVVRAPQLNFTVTAPSSAHALHAVAAALRSMTRRAPSMRA